MYRLIKKVLILVLVSTANSLKCLSLKNQECKIRKVIVDNKQVAFPYKIEVNRCVGSCNNISNLHAKVCIPNTIKNVIVKMLHLMNLTNTTKQVEFHEICKKICKINSNVCSEKQRFNEINAGVNV